MYVLTAIDLDITVHVRYVLQENQRDLARGVGTLEERRLYAVDILECVLKEDQHRGINHLVFVFCMSFIIKVVHVSAEILHSMQNVTIASSSFIHLPVTPHSNNVQNLKQSLPRVHNLGRFSVSPSIMYF